MCFITEKFIRDAKFHMGIIGFKSKSLNELTKHNLENFSIESMFKIENMGMQIGFYYHYN